MASVQLSVYVPRDSSALSVGAEEVAAAIAAHARHGDVKVDIVRNGSRGLYWLEPLVEVVTRSGRRAYGPVRPSDVPSLVAGGAAAAAVMMVAVNYQKPPYCVFSLNPGANVTSPKDMVGLEFGSSTASFMPRIAMAFMKMHGLDSSTLRVVNIDGASRVPMLAARKVQSIDQFVMSEPGIRRAVKDAEAKCMLFGDHGLDIYSNGIGVREDFLQQNPEVVRAFIRAALRGWKDAMSNPEEAAKIQVQYVKALDPALIVDELRIVRRLAVTPDTEKDGYGAMNREKMQRSVDFMNPNVEIVGANARRRHLPPGYLPSTRSARSAAQVRFFRVVVLVTGGALRHRRPPLRVRAAGRDRMVADVQGVQRRVDVLIPTRQTFGREILETPAHRRGVLAAAHPEAHNRSIDHRMPNGGDTSR